MCELTRPASRTRFLASAALNRSALPGLLLGMPGAARAHAGLEHAAAAGKVALFGEPMVSLCLVISLGFYLIGLVRLHRRSRNGRARRLREGACFLAGWLMLASALLSPLDTLGSTYFSAHMVQHEILMLVAAPLLVLGRPFGPWLWTLSLHWRLGIAAGARTPAVGAAWRWLTLPLTAWALHALVLWAWHLPRFFDAALQDEGWHSLQHASFLASALVFWWTVIDDGSRHDQRGMALLSLFTTMLHTGALGALLTFSSRCWYVPYIAATGAAGGDCLADQQLGGLIMWIPGGTVYFAAALQIGARWLGRNVLQAAALRTEAGSPIPRADGSSD